MGNRSTYPAEHHSSTRSTRSASPSSTAAESQGSGRRSSGERPNGNFLYQSTSAAGTSSPSHQTMCPQCQRVLLIPPNAPLFRCPCGVLFRTETLDRHRSFERPTSGLLGATGLMGRSVICRRCRRLSMLPQDSSSDGIAICPCGSPALPLNDMVMSLLAEGELGLLGRGRHGRRRALFRQGDVEGASEDLIELLPTCTFSAEAAARAAAARLGGKSPAPSGAHAPVLDEGAGKNCCGERKKACHVPPEDFHMLKAGSIKAAEVPGSTPPLKKVDSHDDDVSCRICLEDYAEGDRLRVLPCFHRFHAECSSDWLKRKKTCPLCTTCIDVIMRRPEDWSEEGVSG